MNKFTLTFTLHQHTPIIHFQHDQEGATLRATELKPKLDRFIMEALLKKEKIPFDLFQMLDEKRTFFNPNKAFQHAARNPVNEAQKNWASWLVGGEKAEHAALVYKVKVEAFGVNSQEIKEGDRKMNIPMYFGNMGDEYKNKTMGLTSAKEVSISFFSVNTEIISAIESLFPAFIGRTNFGNRQNKGYGSFYLAETDKRYQKLSEIATGTPFFSFKLKGRRDTQDYEEILSVIAYYYQRLKSGINYKDEYQPSFLRDYIHNRYDYTWEKRWMKEKFYPLNPSTPTPKFARALLGMYPQVEFKRTNGPDYHGNTVHNPIKLEISHAEISRIKSPITFKPIIEGQNVRVYVFVDTPYAAPILDQEFEFSNGRKNHSLRTPSVMIDVADLIKEYHKKLGEGFMATDYTGRNKTKVTL